MTRRSAYFTHYEADPKDSLATTVYEPDDSPIPTGILDADGNEIYRQVVRNPIGFIWPKENNDNGDKPGDNRDKIT